MQRTFGPRFAVSRELVDRDHEGRFVIYRGSVREGRLPSYHFDGERIDLVRDESEGAVFRVLP